MHSAKHASRAGEPASSDDLARLLAIEDALAAKLEQARGDAEAVLAAARDEATRSETSTASGIASRLEALTVEHEASLAAELKRIETDASQLVSRLECLSDSEMSAIVSFVISRVLSGGSS